MSKSFKGCNNVVDQFDPGQTNSDRMEAPSWLKGFKANAKGKSSKRSRSPPMAPEATAAANTPNVADNEHLEYMNDALFAGGEATKQSELHHVAKKPAVYEKAKPLKEIMNDALQEGLEKPLDQNNVGFRMLAKMGFREGAGIGKDGIGMANPIGIHISKGRSGLGVEEQKRRALREMLEEQKKTESTLKESFLHRHKKEFEVNQLGRELQKAQKACEQLDINIGITISDMWTRTEASVKQDSDGSLQVENVEKAFRDASGTTYVRNEGDFSQIRAAEDFETMSRKFRSVVEYLKRRHVYCHYCSSRFASQEELEAYCRTDEDCADLFDLD